MKDNKIPSLAAFALAILGIASQTRLVADAMEAQGRRDQELAYVAEITGRATDDILADFEIFPGAWEQFMFQLLNPPGRLEGQVTDRMIIDGYTINEIQLYGGGQYDVASVVLQRRRQLDGPDRWSINDGGCVLDKDGDWVIEPLPSNRSDEYLEMTRFSTPDEAITSWKQLEKPTRFEYYRPELRRE